MKSPETAMLSYARLARISKEKNQAQGVERFLVLTGIAACHAGWLTIANLCFQRLRESFPLNQLAKGTSFASALRSEEGQAYSKQVQRICSPEQAEFLLVSAGDGLLIGELEEKVISVLSGELWEKTTG